LVLREAEGCQPTREELAELLNVSRATLVRRLAAEGNTLRELGNRIRHQRACTLLRNSGQAISQIAYRLGYGDVANFSHAFRALCGISPSDYRGEHRRGGRASRRSS
jgi:AraC-like DNA-binding protein